MLSFCGLFQILRQRRLAIRITFRLKSQTVHVGSRMLGRTFLTFGSVGQACQKDLAQAALRCFGGEATLLDEWVPLWVALVYVALAFSLGLCFGGGACRCWGRLRAQTPAGHLEFETDSRHDVGLGSVTVDRVEGGRSRLPRLRRGGGTLA